MKTGAAGEGGKVEGIAGIEGIEGMREVEQVGEGTPERKKLGVPNGRMSTGMSPHPHPH